MSDIRSLTKKFIIQELNYIIKEEILSNQELEIIKLRYGIDSSPQTLRSISRKTNIKLKNIKSEVEEAERKIFNILKKKI